MPNISIYSIVFISALAICFLHSPTQANNSGIEDIKPYLGSADTSAGATAAIICTACHATEVGAAAKLGPSLWDVLGREVASEAGYSYSSAMSAAEGSSWDYDKLNHFLYNPAEHLPGTKMGYAGSSDTATRVNIIAWLRTLSDHRVELPQMQIVATLVASDPFGADWPQGEAREFTGQICNACHSLAIVKQQGLPASEWDELLDWMVEEQGMADLGEKKAQVVAYLAENFGVDNRSAPD